MAKTVRIRPIDSLRSFKGRRLPAGMPGDVKVGRKRVPELAPAQVAGRAIWPEARRDEHCNLKDKNPLRSCHTELVFLGDKHAPSYDVKPGSYLRICSKVGGKGTVVPVADHQQATKVAQAFCACRRKGGTIASCAKKFG
jgi:hypothetical protein